MSKTYSHVPRWNTNKLLMLKDVWTTVPCIVESATNTGEENPDDFRYTVVFSNGTDRKWFYRDKLREMKWWEFMLFKHPETGETRIGNNPAWPWVYGTALAAVALVLGSPLGGGFGWLAVTLGVMWAGSWLIPLGAYLQYKGIWK